MAEATFRLGNADESKRMNLLCVIDGNPIQEDRAKRRGYACITCSDDCYVKLRNTRRGVRRKKGWYVRQRDRDAFLRWKAQETRLRSARQPLQEAVRSDVQPDVEPA
jgi:hypothetical protein